MKKILISILFILFIACPVLALPPVPLPGPQQTVYDNGIVSTTGTIDYRNGAIQWLTLGGNCTVSFVLPPAGYVTTVAIKVIQHAGAHYNITWTSTKWEEGLVPLITQNDSAVDFISCYLDTTGAYCTYGSDFH